MCALGEVMDENPLGILRWVAEEDESTAAEGIVIHSSQLVGPRYQRIER